MKKLLLCVPLLLIGCTTSSGVIKVGQNNYLIDVAHTTFGSGFSSHAELRDTALRSAGDFCLQRSQEMLLNSSESEGDAGWGAIDDEIKFSCLDRVGANTAQLPIAAEPIN